MPSNGVFSRRMRSDDFDDIWPATESHQVHVLAVDDSLVDRKVIERLLTISSCKVTAVDSGSRALRFLGLDEEKSPVGFDGLKVDLIITDYCMPGMTGYELLKKIKGSSTFREIPVVIMSSENVLARIDRCFEEGAEDFIVKPVKLSDVKRLKNNMFGEQDRWSRSGDKGINKRKLQEMSALSSSTTSPMVSTSSDLLLSSRLPSESEISSLQSPQSSDLSSSASPPSISSPGSPSLSPSLPSSITLSPSELDSPTRRLKMTNFE